MKQHHVLSAAAALAMAFGLVPLHAAGQSDAQKMTAAQIAAELRKPAKGFAQPKTAWGDPDISGVWTSDAALGIPRERDAAQYGDRAFLTDEEYNDAHKADEQRRVAGENAVGAFRNDGAWKTKSYRQTSLVIEPDNGRTPAFTASSQTRAATRDRGSFGEGPFDSPLDFTLYDRCITRGIVGSVMPVVYGNGNRIIQAPGQVILSYEMVHDTRIIYTDGRPHVPSKIRQLLGDSRGHWEGNTLVVDTTNFNGKGWIATHAAAGWIRGIAQSQACHVIERLTRVDANTIHYEATIEDPNVYSRPWTVAFPLNRDEPYRIYEYACHEGNHALENMLRLGDKANGR
jgi:hypothetical protein